MKRDFAVLCSRPLSSNPTGRSSNRSCELNRVTASQDVLRDESSRELDRRFDVTRSL